MKLRLSFPTTDEVPLYTGMSVMSRSTGAIITRDSYRMCAVVGVFGSGSHDFEITWVLGCGFRPGCHASSAIEEWFFELHFPNVRITAEYC